MRRVKLLEFPKRLNLQFDDFPAARLIASPMIVKNRLDISGELYYEKVKERKDEEKFL